jgi:hypothetical protein
VKAGVAVVAVGGAVVQAGSSQRRRKIEVLVQLEVGLVMLRLKVVLRVLEVAISRQALSVVDGRLDGGNLHHTRDVDYRTLRRKEVEENPMMVLGDCTSPHACSDQTWYLQVVGRTESCEGVDH